MIEVFLFFLLLGALAFGYLMIKERARYYSLYRVAKEVKEATVLEEASIDRDEQIKKIQADLETQKNILKALKDEVYGDKK